MKWFASIRLTVYCLLWLSVLTFWGTVYQKFHGLYMAQEIFFGSWFFYGVLPGGMTTMLVLFLNLCGSLFVHYRAGWKMPGLLLIHLGLMMMLAGGFMTKLTGIEGQVSLIEGAGINVVTARDEWELSFWEHPDAVRDVQAVDLSALRKGASFELPDYGIRFRVTSLHENAEPRVLREPAEGWTPPLAAQEVHTFRGKAPDKDPGMDVPGIIMEVEGAKNGKEVLLWGHDPRPVMLERGTNEVCFAALRRKRTELPLFVELVDFSREYYPGSNIPSDFRSRVNIRFGDEQERPVVIKMNEPFRYNGWTFYQQSFAVEGDSERSVFAVTRNYGRLVPYYATGVTSVGLFAHFIQMQWMAGKRRKKKKGGAA